MFNPSRDEARRFLFESWRKYGAAEPLSGLERVAVHVISLHPEYHALLECLAETLWQAQRMNAPPDAAAYLECMKRR